MVENTKANTIIVGDLDVQQMAQPEVKDGVKKKRTTKKTKIFLLKVSET
jgi:putative transposase